MFVHPSGKTNDQIPGYLGIADVPAEASTAGGGESSRAGGHDKAVVVFWIPTSLAEMLDEEGKVSFFGEGIERFPLKDTDEPWRGSMRLLVRKDSPKSATRAKRIPRREPTLMETVRRRVPLHVLIC